MSFVKEFFSDDPKILSIALRRASVWMIVRCFRTANVNPDGENTISSSLSSSHLHFYDLTTSIWTPSQITNRSSIIMTIAFIYHFVIVRVQNLAIIAEQQEGVMSEPKFEPVTTTRGPVELRKNSAWYICKIVVCRYSLDGTKQKCNDVLWLRTKPVTIAYSVTSVSRATSSPSAVPARKKKNVGRRSPESAGGPSFHSQQRGTT